MSRSVEIAVIDYGMGNLRSVEKALEHAGARVSVTGDPESLREADGLVLPGVGAFPKAMENLRRLGLDEVVTERLTSAVPVLGICLGLQLLFEASSEGDGSWGLGLLPGRVEKLDGSSLKVPQIGWNAVRWSRHSALVQGLPDNCPFYFVHSYAPVAANSEDVLGSVAYGTTVTCAVEREPLYGVQFHPEKSSAAGLKLLENFCGICERVKS